MTVQGIAIGLVIGTGVGLWALARHEKGPRFGVFALGGLLLVIVGVWLGHVAGLPYLG